MRIYRGKPKYNHGRFKNLLIGQGMLHVDYSWQERAFCTRQTRVCVKYFRGLHFERLAKSVSVGC